MKKTPTKQSSFRRLGFLGLFLIFLYILGWFFVSNLIGKKFEKLQNSLTQGGGVLEGQLESKGGFPFAWKKSLDKVRFEKDGKVIDASGAKIQAKVSLLGPKAQFQLQDEIKTQGISGSPITLRFEEGKGGVNFPFSTHPEPKTAFFEAKSFAMNDLLQIEGLNVHKRFEWQKNLLQGVLFDVSGRSVTLLNNSDYVLTDCVAKGDLKGPLPVSTQAEAQRFFEANGMLDLDDISCSWGKVFVRLKGQLSLDKEGQPEGKVYLALRNGHLLVDRLKDKISPQKQLVLSLLLMGTKDKLVDLPEPLVLKKGRLSFTGIPLGAVPKISW